MEFPALSVTVPLKLYVQAFVKLKDLVKFFPEGTLTESVNPTQEMLYSTVTSVPI